MEFRINNIEELITLVESSELSFKNCCIVVERTLKVLVFSETKTDLINDLIAYSKDIKSIENRGLFLGLADPLA